MKRGLLILLSGMMAAVLGFAALYGFNSASHRAMTDAASPELAWLKKEFKLGDEEFARISQLHRAYLPECRERCRIIDSQNERLQQLLATNSAVTPALETLLAERARTRADCETAMLRHFLEVSRAMPRQQGQRYLAWVHEHTFLRSPHLEISHATDERHP
jgi:hypothetical protein